MIVFNFDKETDKGAIKYADLLKPSSELFKAVEVEWWKFFNGANPADELEEKYFGEDAIYDKKQAIQGAIEQIFEVMEEEKMISISIHSNKLDFDTCWD